jgi:hypothetical protein
MGLPRRKQDPVASESEPNEEIVSRIEAWLPGLTAPLDWIRTVNFELPTTDEPEESEPSELRRSA